MKITKATLNRIASANTAGSPQTADPASMRPNYGDNEGARDSNYGYARPTKFSRSRKGRTVKKARRRLSRDPVGYKAGTNLNSYAGNNPINKVDPMGTQEETTQDSLGRIPMPPDVKEYIEEYRKTHDGEAPWVGWWDTHQDAPVYGWYSDPEPERYEMVYNSNWRNLEGPAPPEESGGEDSQGNGGTGNDQGSGNSGTGGADWPPGGWPNIYTFPNEIPEDNLPYNGLNYSKLATSLLNAANAGRLYAAGYLKLAAARVGGAGGPALYGWAIWNLKGAQGAWQNSLQQAGEAFSAQQPWEWRNFYGVLPYGTEFDDPYEMYLPDVLRGVGRNLEGNPGPFISDVAGRVWENPDSFLREFGKLTF